MKNRFLPDNVFINLLKGTVTIIFDQPTLVRVNDTRILKDKGVFIAKASTEDLKDFDPTLGFLIAYLHFSEDVSKQKTNEKYAYLFSKPKEYQIPYLMERFCFYSGLRLDQAERFIAGKIKYALGDAKSQSVKKQAEEFVAKNRKTK